MIKSLIIKELRQNWVAFLLVAVLLAIGFLMIVLGVVVTDAGSLLEALRLFLSTFVVLALLVLCNRLVVREYHGKTQLFLESLPLTRLRMVTVKFLLGFALITAVVSSAFLLLLVAGQRGEALTFRFLQIVAARTYAFLLCAYAFFFVMGLLGRYRIVIYLLAILSAAFIETTTKLELARFGPFALLDEQFAYERNTFPAEALWVTLGLAVALMVTVFGLSLIREGSVATMLAEKMSHREKVFLSVLVLGFMISLTVYDEKTEKDPFDLPGAVAKEGSGVAVRVSRTALPDASADRRLADAVWGEMVTLKQYLQISDLPPIFVVLRRDLDADRYERAELEGAEGVLVRANFASRDWDQRDFLVWLVREVLIVASDQRLLWEPRLWVLDGFALYWAERPRAAASELEPRPLVLRAAYGAGAGLNGEDLDTWLSYRQRVGEDIAAAVAWSALTTLARTHGDDDCRQFLRATLCTDMPADIRSLWYDRRHPWPQVLERTCGVPSEDFVRQWIEQLEAARRELADDLNRVPRLDGALHFEVLSTKTRSARFRLTSDPPPESGRFRLVHGELEALDTEVPPSALSWEDLAYPDDRAGELPGTFARGARLTWTFAARSERLGCEVISGWQCQEVR